MSIERLVNEYFLKKSIKVQNIKYKGARRSLGYFEYANKSFPIGQGLLLSTGDVELAKGPNNKSNTGQSVDRKGDKDLDNIKGAGITFDATSLEFDFIPASDSISFQYVFGSEEYPEYVGSRYNDKFAFFLSGPAIKGKINLAVLPDNGGPVSINNINYWRNDNYYIDNSYYNDYNGHLRLWYRRAKYRKLREEALQYDGYTTLLTAKAAVKPYQVYHIKMVIADVGDHYFDSGVFLQAGSFRSYHESDDSPEVVFLQTEPLALEVANAEIPHLLKLDNNASTLTLHINFAFDSDIIPDSVKSALDNISAYMKSNHINHLDITGHTDSMGSRHYNLALSHRRANSVKRYLSDKEGIDSTIIFAHGAGFDMPLRPNSSNEGRAQNRRVEFVFKKEY